MEEFVLIACFLLAIFITFRNPALRSRKWFVYSTIVIAIAAAAYLFISNWPQPSLLKLLLLFIAFNGALNTFLKRMIARARKNRQQLNK